MNTEEEKYIIDKLHNFIPDSNKDCYNQKFGVMRSYGNWNYDTCPVGLTIDLLYTKFFHEKEWERLHG